MSNNIQKLINSDNLSNSYLIKSYNKENSLYDLACMIMTSLIKADISINNKYKIIQQLLSHPDVIFLSSNRILLEQKQFAKKINFEELTQKTASTSNNNIVIEQIRKIKSFISQTSLVSGNKIIIIYNADDLNISASNALLKILEEPIGDSYFFLLSENTDKIIDTIKSRCVFIRDENHNKEQESETDEKSDKYFSIIENHLNSNSNNIEQAQFIDSLLGSSVKEKNLIIWNDISKIILNLMTKAIRYQMNNQLNGNKSFNFASEKEQILINLILQKNVNNNMLINKLDKVNHIINNCNNFDLDLKSNMILLIESL